jgi:hypothetical protein
MVSTIGRGVASIPSAAARPIDTTTGFFVGSAQLLDSLLTAENTPALVHARNAYSTASNMSGREMATGFGNAAGHVALIIGPAKFKGPVRFEARAYDLRVHGNSKLSPKPATLYELWRTNPDGSVTFLKHGVTQNLDKRYSKKFMEDKFFEEVATGARADMLTWERQRVIHNPGPLNLEPWAVKAKGGN